MVPDPGLIIMVDALLKSRYFFALASVFFVLFTSAIAFSTEDVLQGQPVAFLPSDSHEFEPVLHGTIVTHDYIIQNRGTAPLEIKKVKTE